MAAAHYHRVLVEQIHQLGEGHKISLLLVGLQPPVQLQNGLQRPDGQDVAPLGHIGLHTGENFQAVLQLQGVPDPSAHRGDVAVHIGKLEGVEVLRQAQGVQSGPSGLAEEPVGVGGGKWELFGQLPMGVKIQAQEK